MPKPILNTLTTVFSCLVIIHLLQAYDMKTAKKWIKCYGLYSATTRKHISAFAKEHDLQFTDFKEIAGRPWEMNMMTGEILIDGE